MDLRKIKLYHEGKTKKLYSTNDPGILVLNFKDDMVVPEGNNKRIVKNKGRWNNTIVSILFQFLENYHIDTHFIEVLKPNEMAVKKLDMLPIQMLVWNYATGDISQRLGLKRDEPLSYSIVEVYLKNRGSHKSMINADHAYALGITTSEEMQKIDKIVRKINVVLKSFFERRQIILVNFRLEFGRYKDQILLGDDISPNTCIFWDASNVDKIDKERFIVDKGDVETAYRELQNRISSC